MNHEAARARPSDRKVMPLIRLWQFTTKYSSAPFVPQFPERLLEDRLCHPNLTRL